MQGRVPNMLVLDPIGTLLPDDDDYVDVHSHSGVWHTPPYKTPGAICDHFIPFCRAPPTDMDQDRSTRTKSDCLILSDHDGYV